MPLPEVPACRRRGSSRAFPPACPAQDGRCLRRSGRGRWRRPGAGQLLDQHDVSQRGQAIEDRPDLAFEQTRAHHQHRWFGDGHSRRYGFRSERREQWAQHGAVLPGAEGGHVQGGYPAEQREHPFAAPHPERIERIRETVAQVLQLGIAEIDRIALPGQPAQRDVGAAAGGHMAIHGFVGDVDATAARQARKPGARLFPGEIPARFLILGQIGRDRAGFRLLADDRPVHAVSRAGNKRMFDQCATARVDADQFCCEWAAERWDATLIWINSKSGRRDYAAIVYPGAIAAPGQVAIVHHRLEPDRELIIVDRFWLKQYPPGVDAEIDVDAYASIREILESSCRRFGELPAYSNMGVSIRYRELDEMSREFGAYLQHVAGLRKGDRIALMLPNLLQYPVALFGALRAGLVVVNVNPQYTPRELEYQLNDSGASVIVVLENFAHTLEQVIDRVPIKTVITTEVGDLFPPVKGLLTNVVVKHVKKMVPAWRLPGAIPFKAALRRGRDQTLPQRRARPRRHRLPSIHRRHYRRGQGHRAHPWQSGGQHAAVVGLDFPRPGRRRRVRGAAAAAVPHLCADREPGVHEDRGASRPHHQSARPSGLSSRRWASSAPASSSASIPCTTHC